VTIAIGDHIIKVLVILVWPAGIAVIGAIAAVSVQRARAAGPATAAQTASASQAPPGGWIGRVT
jgi:hypothetical protein